MNGAVRPSRTEIVEMFRAATTKLGRPPGKSVFCKLSGLKAADIDYFWPRPADLAREAGATPNTFRGRIPDDEFFEDYARVCLHLGKIPTRPELRIAQRELKTRTHSAFDRFGGSAALDRRFREWLENSRPELSQILNFPGWTRSGPMASRATTTPSGSLPPLLRPFLPAALQYLEPMSRGERPPYETSDLSVSTLFERRCADAFRCLGFEVLDLGQGKGRAADCLALSKKDAFGVIIDAKVRPNGYLLGTEDRKFYEYVVNHARELQHQGIEKIYLAVVGSTFREQDLVKLTSYLTNAPLRSLVFLTAAALMRVVEESIRNRNIFRLIDFERELFGNKIIAA